jgi:hypothetical protein
LVTTVDVDGDLIIDIVGLDLGHFDGNLEYVLGDGHGIFRAAHELAGLDTGQVVVSRDMNRDGRHDFIIPENMPSDS